VIRRSAVRIGAAGAILFAMCGMATAQPDAWPSRPIRIVVPFPPGGAVDLVGRAVGRGLAEALRANVVIENRPGASAMLGAEQVARASADGYTMLMGSMSALAVNPSLHRGTIRYDPLKDFEPVALVAHTPGVLAVNPRVPAVSVAQLVELARAKPGMTYASSGNGNFQHLVGELFRNAAGLELRHVPYKGSAPALVDAISGQVDMIFDVVPSAAPLIRSGQLRGLAVTSARRADVLPDVPTMAEAGYAGFDVSSWYGVVVPAGTPAAVISRLNAAILAWLKLPDTRKQLADAGAAPLGSTAAEFGAHVKSENVRWAEVIRANRIAVD